MTPSDNSGAQMVTTIVTGRVSWNREVVVTWRSGPRGTRWLEANGHASRDLRLIAILVGTSSEWATLPMNARRLSAGTWRSPKSGTHERQIREHPEPRSKRRGRSVSCALTVALLV